VDINIFPNSLKTWVMSDNDDYQMKSREELQLVISSICA